MSLSLNLDQVNLVLEALGELPFARVHQLIGEIQQQASDQLRDVAAQFPKIDSPDSKA